jgi:hypothetical protein
MSVSPVRVVILSIAKLETLAGSLLGFGSWSVVGVRRALAY